MTATVLIVEDEENILISLEFLLSAEGYRVLVARDGGEATHILDTLEPDLVLLDVMLPVVDGFELCRLIRKNPALATTRIILLTAKGREAEIEKGIALGVNAHVTKPFSTRELMATVRRLLAESSATAAANPGQGSM